MKLTEIGRDGANAPLFRDKITGTKEKDTEVLSEIEKNEKEYQDHKFKGIAVKGLSELKVSEYISDRLSSPDKRKIHWIEYAFYLMGDLKGKRVCDYGCGHGEFSVHLARSGAQVEAFDISPQGVTAARKIAAANKVEGSVEVEVRSAHSTGYPSDYFDVVYASGVLHHLCLEHALPEIKRILKPGGRFVFLEPVITSSFIEFLKWKTPIKRFLTLGTASKFEKSLEDKEIRQITEAFDDVHIDRFRFFARFESKLNSDYKKIYRLYYMDYIFFKIAPFMKSYASAIVGSGTK